ncbi:unnamed protein product, partial [Effrenium voratum]
MNHEGDHLERAPSKRQEKRSQEVWAENLVEEMARMSDVAENFLYVAVDTQFPGLVVRPKGPFASSSEYHFASLKSNVDLTKVLQVSFTFSDPRGIRPKGICTWRFNFSFNSSRDFYSQEVVENLHQQRNLNIQQHMSKGIQPNLFAELLLGSGLVLNEDVHWITYRGTNSFSNTEDGHPGRPELPQVMFSGLYDFAHLLRMLRGGELIPDEVNAFFDSLDLFFPCRCDVSKHLHRLPQLNGSSARNAHYILDAFFRLPDAVRRTAFEPEEREAVVMTSDVMEPPPGFA